MRKVYRLLDEMLSGIDYDIFRPGNWENWEHSLSMFNRRLEHVSSEAKSIIDIGLTMLTSSDLGLELIRDIKTIDTRDDFVDFISSKHENLLRFFVSEINVVEYEYLVILNNNYFNEIYLIFYIKIYFYIYIYNSIIRNSHQWVNINQQILVPFNGLVF